MDVKNQNKQTKTNTGRYWNSSQQTVQPQIEITTANNVELQMQVDIEKVPKQTLQSQIEIITLNNVELQIQVDIEIVHQQTVQPQIEITTPNNVELQIQVGIEIVPQQTVQGAQWLSGRVLDWRPRGRGFEHWLHCVVVIEQHTFILA